MSHGGLAGVTFVLVVAGGTLSPNTQEALPRPRGDAALVQVDAYISRDGTAITDLRLPDVEVFEDDRPQQVVNMVLVQSRRLPAAIPNLQNPDGALFVLFLDTGHVSSEHAARAHDPLSKWLSAIMAPHDRVGIMTPEMSAQNIALDRAAGGVDALLRDLPRLSQDVDGDSDARDRELAMCYPETRTVGNERAGTMAGVANELIERRREQKTLRALDDLVTHLEQQRNERKFVILITQGWALFRRNEQLAATGGDPRRRDASLDACERERVALATVDDVVEARKLAQRANRANVSIYPIDPAGFGTSSTVTSSAAERELSAARQNGLRDLATQTDAIAVLAADEAASGAERVRADLGSYYLLSYYPSNPALDGRFRRVSVRVKREDVEVRTRPGYLSLTEADARARGLALPSSSGGRPSSTVVRPNDSGSASVRSTAARVQATGDVGRIRAVIEIDGAALLLADWLTGGSVRMSIEPEGGGPVDTTEAVLAPGQRVAALVSKSTLLPGRYAVRAQLSSNTGALVLQGATKAAVPVQTAVAGTAALASRRGPGTAAVYQPTADPRFRRTERIQIEVPVLSGQVSTSGRLLTQNGRPMPLPVVVSERVEGPDRWAVAEAGLAPLAAGEYVFELSISAGERTEIVPYTFRVIP